MPRMGGMRGGGGMRGLRGRGGGGGKGLLGRKGGAGGGGRERLLGNGKLLEAGKKGLEAMGGPQGIVDMVKGFVDMGGGGAGGGAAPPDGGGGAAGGAAPAAAAPADGAQQAAPQKQAPGEELQRLQAYLAAAGDRAELARRVERIVGLVGAQYPQIAQLTREVGAAVAQKLPG